MRDLAEVMEARVRRPEVIRAAAVGRRLIAGKPPALRGLSAWFLEKIRPVVLALALTVAVTFLDPMPQPPRLEGGGFQAE